MMGLWFVALGFGGELAGILAKMASIPQSIQTISAEINFYGHAFLQYALLGLVMAAVVGMSIPLLRRMLSI